MIEKIRKNLSLITVTLLSALGCLGIFISSIPFQENSLGFSYQIFLDQILMILIGTFLAWVLCRSSYFSLKKVFTSVFVLSLILILFGYVSGNLKDFSVAIGGTNINPLGFLYPSFVVLISWIVFSFRKIGNSNLGLAAAFGLVLLLVVLFSLMGDFNSTVIIFLTSSIQLLVAGASLNLFFLLFVLLILAVGAIALYFPSVIQWIPSFFQSDGTVITESLVNFQFLNMTPEVGQLKYMMPDPYSGFFIPVMNEDIGWIFSLVILSIFMIFIFDLIILSLKLQAEKANILLGITIQLGLQVILSFGIGIDLFPEQHTLLPFLSHNMSNMISSGLVLGLILNFSSQRDKLVFRDN